MGFASLARVAFDHVEWIVDPLAARSYLPSSPISFAQGGARLRKPREPVSRNVLLADHIRKRTERQYD